jgi:hypothetical protein
MVINITYADGSQGILWEDDDFFARECVKALEAREDIISVTAMRSPNAISSSGLQK